MKLNLSTYGVLLGFVVSGLIYCIYISMYCIYFRVSYFKELVHYIQGRTRIYGKRVHIYNGGSLCRLYMYLIFPKYPLKIK